jgi:hypothetical protein
VTLHSDNPIYALHFEAVARSLTLSVATAPYNIAVRMLLPSLVHYSQFITLKLKLHSRKSQLTFST